MNQQLTDQVFVDGVPLSSVRPGNQKRTYSYRHPGSHSDGLSSTTPGDRRWEDNACPEADDSLHIHHT